MPESVHRRSSGSAEQPLVKAEVLGKTYMSGPSPTIALENVNLQLAHGQMLAVYGPSGSGKTTLLSLLGGLDKPTTGRVLLDGTDISHLDEHALSTLRRAAVSFVFQNYNLVEELTALENVQLPLVFEATPREDALRRARAMVEHVGLPGAQNKRPFQLSAGEQQRIAVARALVKKPRLVLMDEPTGNLDQDNSQNLLHLITRENKDEGISFIVATHNMDIVEAFPSRLHLNAGRPVQDE